MTPRQPEKAGGDSSALNVSIVPTRTHKLNKAPPTRTSALPSTVKSPVEDSTTVSQAKTRRVVLDMTEDAVDQDQRTDGLEENPVVLEQGPIVPNEPLPPSPTAAAASTITPPSPALQANKSYSQHRCEELEDKLSEADEKIIKLEEHVAVLEENLEHLIDQANEVQKVREQVEEDKKKIENDYLEHQRASEGLLNDKQRLNKLLRETKTDYDAVATENEKLTREKRDINREKALAVSEKQALLSAHTACATRLAKQQEEISNLSKARTTLQQHRDGYKRRAEKFESAHTELASEFAALEISHSEAQQARDAANVSEERIRVAAREWKNKFTAVNQEKQGLVEHCNNLLKENSNLRAERSIDDDKTLLDKYGSLKYWVRNWCDQVVESKSPGVDARFQCFPLDAQEPVFLTRILDDELTVLISSVWEWLMKLVFGINGRPGVEDGHPDLWTDEETRMCLNALEQHFDNSNRDAAARWRHITVQQLERSGLCNHDARIDTAVDEILDWTRSCFELAAPVGADVLKNNLKAQVIDRAVSFALDLRRQSSVVVLQLPRSLGQVLRNNPVIQRRPYFSPDDRKLKICIAPRLTRLMGEGEGKQAGIETIIEADLHTIDIQAWPPKEAPSDPESKGNAEIEVRELSQGDMAVMMLGID